MTDCRRYSLPMSKAIFTVLDKGAYTLHSLFEEDKRFCNHLLKEYIYLKAFIFVARLRASVSASPAKTKNVAEEVINETFAILDSGFRNDPLGFGCSIVEMNERIKYYYSVSDLNNFDTIRSAFLDVIGSINCLYYHIPTTEVLKIPDLAFIYIDENIGICAASGKKTQTATGSGCLLPVLAWLLIVAILAI